MKWNTIDTLPPEGRVVLGCFGGTVTECGMFGDMWLSTDFGEIEPEYWMHMPEPPSTCADVAEKTNTPHWESRATPNTTLGEQLVLMQSEIEGLRVALEKIKSQQPVARVYDKGKAERSIERLKVALRFYARGQHLSLDDKEDFDTVSGESENWLCSGVENSATMVEDGAVARFTLQGKLIQWCDGGEDETPQPIDGEKAAALFGSFCPSEEELDDAIDKATNCSH